MKKLLFLLLLLPALSYGQSSFTAQFLKYPTPTRPDSILIKSSTDTIRNWLHTTRSIRALGITPHMFNGNLSTTLISGSYLSLFGGTIQSSQAISLDAPNYVSFNIGGGPDPTRFKVSTIVESNQNTGTPNEVVRNSDITGTILPNETLQAVTNRGNSTTKSIQSTNKIFAGDSTGVRYIVAVGTSFTAASAQTSIDSGYLKRVTKNYGFITTNMGLSGRTMQQISVGDNSIYDIRATIPAPVDPANSYILLEGFPNDVVKDTTLLTPTLFTSQTGTIIDGLRANGWIANHIILYDPGYYSTTIYTNHGNIPYRHSKYVAAANSLVSSKGVRFFSTYNELRIAQQLYGDYIKSDSLHATDKGAGYEANLLQNYFTTTIGLSPLSYNVTRNSVLGSQIVGFKSVIGDDQSVGGSLTVNGSGTFGGGLTIGNNLTILGNSTFIGSSAVGVNKLGLNYGYSYNGTRISYIRYSSSTTNNNMIFGDISGSAPVTNYNFITGAIPTATTGITAVAVTYNSTSIINRLLKSGTTTGPALGLVGGLGDMTGAYQDTTTAASGTTANSVGFSFRQPTFTAKNTGVTVTNGYSYYFPAAPTAGTNVSVTTGFAVGFGGLTRHLAGLYAGSADQFKVSNTGTVTAGVWNGSQIGVTYGGLNTTTAPTTGQIPIATSGTVYTPTTVSGDLTNAGGAFTIANNAITTAKIAANVVTYPKIQAASSTFRLLGSQSTTAIGEIGVGIGLTYDATSLRVDTTTIKSKASALADYNNLSGRISASVPQARTISTTSPITGGGNLGSNLTLALAPGTANQVLGTNAAGTASEYKSIVGGANISVTQGAGTITIASTNTATTSEITANTSGAVQNRYVTNSASRIVVLLPSTAAQGDVIFIVGKGSGGWQVGQNSGQTIHGNASDTTTGTTGYLQSQSRYNCVELRCSSANTDWVIVNSNGALTTN